MKVRGLVRNDAKRWSEMEGSVMGSKGLTPTRVKNGLKMFVVVVLLYL